MTIFSKFDKIHLQVKQNRWMRYFAVFNRIVLALGFLPSGYTKIVGERFTDLHNNHPMGNYLEALYHTGYYYTFIGIVQFLAAVLLLIPRTATLGAVLYFPLILNICILSLSVRFDGSLLTAPWMVLANLYLLCWDYDKLKFIFLPNHVLTPKPIKYSNKFPIKFFVGVFVIVIGLGFLLTNVYEVMPKNTISVCKAKFKNTKNEQTGYEFCECIHTEGKSLDICLEKYEKSKTK